MERIELDTEYGLLTVRYESNQWKKNRLEPLRLRWNPTSKAYETSFNRTEEVINHIKAIGSYVKLSPRIQEAVGLNEFGQNEDQVKVDIEKWAYHESFADQPSESFDTDSIGFRDGFTAYGYQLAGIEQAANKNGRILIADEMGLGKTLQACGVIGICRKYLPAVIVCPNSVLYNWKSELLRFLDFLDEDDICILDDSSKKPEQLISICTHRYAVTHEKEIKEYLNVRGILIVDEAHTGKEKDTQVGSAQIDLAHFAKCYVPLTGTPVLNYVRELFAILNGLDLATGFPFLSLKVALQSLHCQYFCFSRFALCVMVPFWQDKHFSVFTRYLSSLHSPRLIESMISFVAVLYSLIN